MKFLKSLTLATLLMTVYTGDQKAQAADLPAIAAKEELTIVVTDSGLGGLSVAADIARRTAETGSHRRMNIIFYNALFDAETGYNSLATRDDKVRIFNNALTDMGERYSPDLIMVACNTLSVLLPDCSYAQDGSVPVLGIVETGVDLIANSLTANPDAAVVIFATPTTIDEDSHNAALIARGIDSSRIIQQPCRDLTFYIEQEFDGFDTELMISTFVGDAAEKLSDPATPIFASFNCTHFGYSLPLWEQEIAGADLELEGFIDPNEHMADFLFTESIQKRFEAPEVSVRFVTMVPLSDAAVASISRAIRPTSEAAASALENHKLVPDLFPWREEGQAKPEVIEP